MKEPDERVWSEVCRSLMMQTQDGAELCFPQLPNTSCRKPTAQSNTMFLNILLVSVSVLTVFLNLLIIISVSHFRQLHTPTNILLLSLGVSDFPVGLLVMPGEIFRLTACWFLGHMVFISAERYVAICDPLHYPTRVTVQTVKFCVFLCWLCSIFYSCLFLKDDLTQPDRHNLCYGKCVIVIDYIVGIIDIVISFIVPITAIIVLYMKVFVVAVSQARAMRSHITAVTLQRSVTLTTKKSELKAARTLGVLVLVFLMCFCPYYCVSLAGDSVFNGSSAAYALFLFYFNSCLNPVIYALFYPWFRKSVKLIVTLQILQPGSCEANVQ
uniref:G-protein coupled receptors family 1 profile domain-containing protein n=1 Tax=Monopterus albus TaxID=43700 RepID=A0A3Q3QTF3_MONAL